MCSSTRSCSGAQTRNSHRPSPSSREPRWMPNGCPGGVRVSVALFTLIHQEHGAQRRECQIHGPLAAVQWNGHRVDAAQGALATAAVELSVAVQDFFPVSAPRYANLVVVPRHGGEVQDYHDFLLRIRARPPQQADDALLGVAAIDPLE